MVARESIRRRVDALHKRHAAKPRPLSEILSSRPLDGQECVRVIGYCLSHPDEAHSRQTIEWLKQFGTTVYYEDRFLL